MNVSILLVRALVDELENAGVLREDFLAGAGLVAADIQRTDAWISLERYDRLVELAIERTGDEGFGLRLGRRTHVTAHSLTGHLVAQATTLRRAIETLMRYTGLMVEGPAVDLTERGAEATLLYHVAPGRLACRRFRAELAMTGYCRIVQSFARGAWPKVVAFEHDAPPYREKYARIFQGRERFSSPFSGVVFDRAFLDAEQLHSDADFHAALEQQAARRLARRSESLGYAERTRAHLLDPATRGRRDMTSTAKALGVSVRTLRRRLQGEGSSYTELVEQTVPSVAKRLLRDDRVSIEQAAYDLGFSSPSAFHKAFKRWTGITPGEYRARAEAD